MHVHVNMAATCAAVYTSDDAGIATEAFEVFIHKTSGAMEAI